MTTKTRYRVSALVGELGARSHMIAANSPKDARARFRAAYPGQDLFGVRIMTPEEVEAHQEQVLEAWEANRASLRVGGAS
ncbi:hypothetical protein [uncultured Celeribacter sp.]|uniref:hypothetical protein n=1 Tax=uncultured Celeribacter sp. TaxID=1303376 RepID=UPI002AA73EB1|nr:hypothetical protein [uncultured Celeribacter sp.]